MAELGFKGLAEKLCKITGGYVSPDELKNFAKPYIDPHLVVGDKGLLQGNATYYSRGFGATFNLTLQDEELTVQRIYPEEEITPQETVLKTLNALIYLVENPNSGMICSSKQRMSFNVI